MTSILYKSADDIKLLMLQNSHFSRRTLPFQILLTMSNKVNFLNYAFSPKIKVWLDDHATFIRTICYAGVHCCNDKTHRIILDQWFPTFIDWGPLLVYWRVWGATM